MPNRGSRRAQRLEQEEVEIVRTTTGDERPALPKVLSPQRILALQSLVRRVPAPENVVRHAVALVRATRPDSCTEQIDGAAANRIKEFVSFGAGPRASQYLVLGAKARAALKGRPAPTIEDVRSIAIPVLALMAWEGFKAGRETLVFNDVTSDLSIHRLWY